MKKKTIIIIAAVVVAVIAAIIGVTIALGSLYSGDTESGSSAVEVSSSTGPASLSVGSAEGEKGDIVKITVDISSNPGFMATLMNLEYDAKAVKYIGYEKGDILSDYEFSDSDGVLSFICCEEGNVSDNGTLFTLKFEMLSDKGSDIKITKSDIINYDEAEISANITNGKITAK